jgi:opacity protein-like surface antigen
MTRKRAPSAPIWGLALIVSGLGAPAMAQDAAAPASIVQPAASGWNASGWNFTAELYGWMPSINPKLTSGQELKIDFGDILDSLQFTFMSAVKAKKDRWGMFADVVYLDIEQSKSGSISVGPVEVADRVSVEMKSWIVNLGATYEFARTRNSTFEVVGGARYLSVETLIGATIGPISKGIDETDTVWDGFVGIAGKSRLDDKWSLTYYADIGSGGSNLTWQALASVDYSVRDTIDLTVGYRHIDWQFHSFGPLDRLYVTGPYAGVKLRF